VREAVLTNLWPTALNLQPTYVGPKAKPSWLPDCFAIKAGTLLNIWLYLPRDTRDCEC
jgi:hypothetical protein